MNTINMFLLTNMSVHITDMLAASLRTSQTLQHNDNYLVGFWNTSTKSLWVRTTPRLN